MVCAGARNGIIEIGYLFYSKIKEKREKTTNKKSTEKIMPILTRNSFFLSIYLLVWCWHSDLELCVVIFCCLLRRSFVWMLFFLFLSGHFSMGLVHPLWLFVFLCDCICAIVSKRRCPKKKSKWKHITGSFLHSTCVKFFVGPRLNGWEIEIQRARAVDRSETKRTEMTLHKTNETATTRMQ